jgi:hypothetical protein
MNRLLLFGKRPRRGKVKTRLVPPLTNEQALRLYRAFLCDQLAFLRRFTDVADVEWCADGPVSPAERANLGAEGIPLELQGPGNLGRRLLRALDRTSREGAGATVVIGADSPTLPPAHVREAFRVLERGAPAVIAPAEDGGYVLVGMRRPLAELFRGVRWGESDVADTTRDRAARINLHLEEIEPWYDIDDLGGLRRLRSELSLGDAPERAPATARALVDLELPPVV